MASGDAFPIPRKLTAYRVTFPIFDADGDLVTGAAGLDSEVSKDGGAFADCTNEATEIGSSGIYYLDLTGSEMDADTVAIIVKTSTSGAKTTPIIMYPEEPGDVRVDAVRWAGETISPTNQPGVPEVDITFWLGGAVPAPDTAGYPVVTIKDGTGQGEIALTSGAVDTVTNVANNVTVDLDDIANAVWQSIMSPIWGLGDVVSSTSSTLVIDVLEGDFPDDFFNGLLVIVTDTSDIKQIRLVTDYVASTQTLTISPNWVTNPDNTYVFSFYAFVASSGGLDAAGVRAAVGLASANLDTQLAGLDSLIDTVDSNVDSVLADTNELQTDWANGGRLDLILDARASQASVDTIDDFLDMEVAAILADTNELQTDWADGGRLDLILDARASQASVDTIDNFLDTEIAAILEDTGTTLPAQISALNDLSAAEAVTAILEGVIEGTTTLQEAVRLLLAAMVGESSGGGTTEIKFRDLADTKDRITATVDANGNRSAVVRDAS